MKILEWENEYTKFLNNYNWYDVAKEKDLINNTLRLTVGNKFKCTITTIEDDVNYEYDGCQFNAKGELVHILKNIDTNQEKEFKLNEAGYMFDVKANKFDTSKVSKFTNRIIEDLKFKVFIRVTNRTDEYQKKAYVDLCDILKVLEGRLEEAFKEYAPLLTKCLKYDFPFPMGLEKRLDEVRVYYYIPLKNELKINNTLTVMNIEEGIDSEGLKKLIKNKSKNKYVVMAKVYVQEKLKQELSEDEKVQCNFVIKQANRLSELGVSSKLLHQLLKDSTSVVLMKGDRLATKREYENLYYGTQVVYRELITKQELSRVNCLVWAMTGNEKYYLDMGKYAKNDVEVGNHIIDYLDNNDKKVENATRKLHYSLNWAEQTDFDKLASLIEEQNIEYLDSAEDEIGTDGIKIEEMVRDVYGYKGDKKNVGQVQFAVDLISKFPIDTIHQKLKIVKCIMEAYEIIRESDIFNQELTILDKAILVDKQARMIPRGVSAEELGIKISKSVAKYGKASEKQAFYIEKAFQRLLTVDKKLKLRVDAINSNKGKVTETPKIETMEQLGNTQLNDIYSMFS
jgi:hypothetical protein